jgi:hypothetical protein
VILDAPITPTATDHASPLVSHHGTTSLGILMTTVSSLVPHPNTSCPTELALQLAHSHTLPGTSVFTISVTSHVVQLITTTKTPHASALAIHTLSPTLNLQSTDIVTLHAQISQTTLTSTPLVNQAVSSLTALFQRAFTPIVMRTVQPTLMPTPHVSLHAQLPSLTALGTFSQLATSHAVLLTTTSPMEAALQLAHYLMPQELKVVFTNIVTSHACRLTITTRTDLVLLPAITTSLDLTSQISISIVIALVPTCLTSLILMPLANLDVSSHMVAQLIAFTDSVTLIVLTTSMLI